MSPSPRPRWKPPSRLARIVARIIPKGSPPYRAALAVYLWWRRTWAAFRQRFASRRPQPAARHAPADVYTRGQRHLDFGAAPPGPVARAAKRVAPRGSPLHRPASAVYWWFRGRSNGGYQTGPVPLSNLGPTLQSASKLYARQLEHLSDLEERIWKYEVQLRELPALGLDEEEPAAANGRTTDDGVLRLGLAPIDREAPEIRQDQMRRGAQLVQEIKRVREKAEQWDAMNAELGALRRKVEQLENEVGSLRDENKRLRKRPVRAER
jgi:hypothetical protein